MIPLLRDVRTNSFFFFNDTATTEIYTLSLHDALPILIFQRVRGHLRFAQVALFETVAVDNQNPVGLKVCKDRKSTRLNSSHSQISYAVFCLKKKNRGSQPR